MIIDARSLPQDATIESDVCIVGAGPAGIVIAREFVDTDLRVCLLESGGLRMDVEATALADGDVTGVRYAPLDHSRGRGFGGTSNLWDIEIGPGSPGARMVPVEQMDLEAREWVPHSGWPFEMDELAPYLEWAHTAARLGPYAYEAGPWTDGEDPYAPLYGEPFRGVVFRLGSATLFTQAYREEIKRADRIRLYTHATVTEFETSRSGEEVIRAHVATLVGNTFAVAAATFVLAAGGIDNPRLLLVSNKVHPHGIGNEHDLVGRFFMEHPHLRVGFIVPADPSVLERFPVQTIQRLHGVPVERWLALRGSVMRREELLSCAVRFTPTEWRRRLRRLLVHRPVTPAVTSLKTLGSALRKGKVPDHVTAHLGNVIRGLDEIAASGSARLRWLLSEAARRRTGNGGLEGSAMLGIDVMSEQAPNPDSRITLSDRLDLLGVPLASQHWVLTPLDLRTVIRVQELVGEEAERAGLGRAYPKIEGGRWPRDLHGGYHHMGTTRMNPDPRYGVVDENCRVHGVANLFVAGSSVFPTSGFANPTLTIMALALRLARHLKERVTGAEAPGAASVGGLPSS